MTLIGPGTWEAARGALDAAIGAADLVAAGEPLVYALCRPPGHHATRSAIGGSCYLNNAAAAAARLRERLGGPVAVLDIDAHHGNGTQEIFWERRRGPDRLGARRSRRRLVPPLPRLRGRDRSRRGRRRQPATWRSRRDPATTAWLTAVERLAGWAAAGGARALVVALGVDAAASDPESPLEVTAAGYRQAGELLGGARPADRRRPGGRLRPRDDRPARPRDPQRPRPPVTFSPAGPTAARPSRSRPDL